MSREGTLPSSFSFELGKDAVSLRTSPLNSTLDPNFLEIFQQVLEFLINLFRNCAADFSHASCLLLADDSGEIIRSSYTQRWLEPATVVSPGYRQDSASSELSTIFRIANHNYYQPLLRQHALVVRTVPYLPFLHLASSPR